MLDPPSLIAEADVPNRLASEATPLLSEGPAVNEKTKQSVTTQCIAYGAALAFVLVTGVAAWAIDERMHRGQSREGPEEVMEWKSQVLGWISAVLYCTSCRKCSQNVTYSCILVGARIPQICK